MQEGALTWSELVGRTCRDAVQDDVLGLAAQLSYYFFLALFPAILFVLVLASFSSLSHFTDDLARILGPFVSPQVLELVQDQMRRLASSPSGTIGVALFVLLALPLVLLGAALAAILGNATGWGRASEWTWLALQWPPVFALVATAIGLVYYFRPDADQDWVGITPGAVIATVLWLHARDVAIIVGAGDPPGERGVSEADATGADKADRRLEISLNRMNEIVLGKRGITAETALRLARLLNMSPRFWMRPSSRLGPA